MSNPSVSAGNIKTISVFGAGSWGTALAIYLARKAYSVMLWHNVPQDVARMNEVRQNEVFMPGIEFPPSLVCVDSLQEAVEKADLLLIVVPSKVFRSVLNQIKPYVKKHQPIIWATKGVDAESGQLMDGVAEEIFGQEAILGVLSGPNFAVEVAQGLPAASTLACCHQDALPALCQVFESDLMQIDGSDDMTGAEVGGVVKNVIAIAVGICDGLKLGANARAALMTRGLEEMLCLGKALGAKEETIMGLAGVGDLILTCTDDKSRNRRFGLLLGQGKSADEALKIIGQVVEGYANVQEVKTLAKRMNVHMPIVETVFEMIQHPIDPNRVALTLLQH
ncbi:MAG: NAD(P)H-dependent glycerol-3-phosphate dehydrogenase [Gammaproteobacteria bacterium]|jgi:glycerol-3-phosphate dehydrogenase (NAD(P)+)|nr:NAD(P)H-dependent glycerol-3-phosphate dehydrogenase [Gammaproteobacteria bacterium]